MRNRFDQLGKELGIKHSGSADVAAVEAHNIHRTVLAELNAELHDDLLLVTLNGKVIRCPAAFGRSRPVTGHTSRKRAKGHARPHGTPLAAV